MILEKVLPAPKAIVSGVGAGLAAAGVVMLVTS